MPSRGPAPRSVSRSKEIEDWLDKESVDWVFHPEIDLRAFDEQKSLHNQVRFQPLEEAVVEAYTDAVKRGDRFPAILIKLEKKQYVRLDGNHRFAAYWRNNKPGIPAYEVFVSGMQATMLAFRANARHGVPNSEDERLSHAIYLMDSDIGLAQAAAICMVSERALRTRWAKRQADRRADEVGLLRTEWDSLLPAVRGRLLMLATDEGFRAAATLAYRARLTSTEAFQLVSEVNSTKSGTRQAGIVKSIEANLYAERIRELAGGITAVGKSGRGRGPKPRLGMALGALAALPDDLASLAGLYQGPERHEVAQRCRNAAERIMTLAEKLDSGTA